MAKRGKYKGWASMYVRGREKGNGKIDRGRKRVEMSKERQEKDRADRQREGRKDSVGDRRGEKHREREEYKGERSTKKERSIRGREAQRKRGV
jgi:hypothetical protein